MNLKAMCLYILLLSTAFHEVLAQWYDHQPSDLSYSAPKGWTYLLDLGDSVEVQELKKVDRTIFINLSDQRLGHDIRGFKLLSRDEGRSWDTLAGEVGDLPSSYSNTRYRISIDSGFAGTYRYSDYETDPTFVPFDKETMGSILGNQYWCAVNPRDDRDIFLHLSHMTAGRTFMKCLHSTDGGGSWKYQKLPTPKGLRNEYLYQLYFNVRNSNLWYAFVDIGAPQRVDSLEYGLYLTTDDGISFDGKPDCTPKHEGSLEIFGISNECEVRGFIRNKKYEVEGINSTEKGVQYWLRRMYGDRLDTMTIGTRRVTLNTKSYHYDWNRPTTQIILAEYNDSTFYESDAFVTYDDGESWINVLQMEQAPVSNLWYDHTRGDLIVDISEHAHVASQFNRHHIWMKPNAVSSVRDCVSKETSQNLTISPNPARAEFVIATSSHIYSPLSLTIYDVLGNIVYEELSGSISYDRQHILVNMPFILQAGHYSVVVSMTSFLATGRLIVIQ